MRALARGPDGAVALCEKTLKRSRPGPREVLVQVSVCYIEPSADTAAKESILAGQGVGKALAVGEMVSRCAVGDILVFFHAEACAQQVLVQEDQIALKPHALDASLAAAALKPAIEAYTALFYKMHVQPDDTVLVTDPDSAFGRIALQLAAHHGAVPVVVGDAPRGEEAFAPWERLSLPRLDALANKDRPNDGTTRSDMDLDAPWVAWRASALAEVETCTSGFGFDHVLDCGAPPILLADEAAVDTSALRANWRIFLCQALSVHGTLATREANVELDAEDSAQLAVRGASIGFVSYSAWTTSPLRRDRLLHVVDSILVSLDQGIFSVRQPREESLADAAALCSRNDADCSQGILVRL